MIELISSLYLKAGAMQAVPSLLAMVGEALKADRAWLSIDNGNSYLRFAIPDNGESEPWPSVPNAMAGKGSAVYALLLQHLPVGRPGRRAAPRSCLAFYRTPGQGDFTETDYDIAAQLMPHISHAISLTLAQESERQRASALQCALGHADHGTLLIDGRLQIIHASQHAESLLKRRLEPDDKPFDHLPPSRRLLIDAALRHAIELASPNTHSLSVLIQDDAPPLSICIRPARTASSEMSHRLPHELMAVVLLRQNPSFDPVALPAMCPEHLFALTPAELRLCNALRRGISLKACAREWGLSYDTLRSQLKRIFLKTGARRQAELVVALESASALPVKDKKIRIPQLGD
jgi:DNA-binding CsgD family transcriptional regulator